MVCSSQQVQIHQIGVFIIMMIILSTEFDVDYMDQPTDVYSFLNCTWHHVLTFTMNFTFAGQSNESKVEDFCALEGTLKNFMDECFSAPDDHYTAPV